MAAINIPAQQAIVTDRRIRSFVRRQGRITRGQQRALEVFWPCYGVEFTPDILNLDALFGRAAPKVLEIGFGMGDTLVDTAVNHPEKDYFGIEVYQSGVGHVLSRASQLELKNLRVSQTDAVDVLTKQIAKETLDEVCLFFPDPWHKKRHHKRRLVQTEFTQLIRDRLKPNGVFHIATDWEDYAHHILAVLNGVDGLTNLASQGGFIPRPESRSLTKFERRGQRLGHSVFDIKFYKNEAEYRG